MSCCILCINAIYNSTFYPFIHFIYLVVIELLAYKVSDRLMQFGMEYSQDVL